MKGIVIDCPLSPKTPVGRLVVAFFIILQNAQIIHWKFQKIHIQFFNSTLPKINFNFA